MRSLLKNIYHFLPFKKQLYLIIRRLNISERIYKHLHFKNIFSVKVDTDNSFKINHYGFRFENSIFWSGLFGDFEGCSLKLWVNLSKRSDVILDIGANTGVFSLAAKAANKKSQIFAFEPVNRVYKKLVENINLNDYDITSYQKAISNKTGKAVIYDDISAEHVYSVTVNKNLNPSDTKTEEIEIDTLRLDEFIENYKIKKIDLIKIDVETHEAEVLDGYGEFLALHKPTILIEVLNDEIANKITNIVAGLEYLYFDIDEKKGTNQVKNISKSSSYNYLLCSHDTALQLNLI